MNVCLFKYMEDAWREQKAAQDSVSIDAPCRSGDLASPSVLRKISSKMYSLLPSTILTQRFRRKRKRNTLPFHKRLELRIEIIAILHRNHRDGIGSFNSVGIAIASDNLGSYNIERWF